MYVPEHDAHLLEDVDAERFSSSSPCSWVGIQKREATKQSGSKTIGSGKAAADDNKRKTKRDRPGGGTRR